MVILFSVFLNLLLVCWFAKLPSQKCKQKRMQRKQKNCTSLADRKSEWKALERYCSLDKRLLSFVDFVSNGRHIRYREHTIALTQGRQKTLEPHKWYVNKKVEGKTPFTNNRMVNNLYIYYVVSFSIELNDFLLLRRSIWEKMCADGIDRGDGWGEGRKRQLPSIRDKQ